MKKILHQRTGEKNSDEQNILILLDIFTETNISCASSHTTYVDFALAPVDTAEPMTAIDETCQTNTKKSIQIANTIQTKFRFTSSPTKRQALNCMSCSAN